MHLFYDILFDDVEAKYEIYTGGIIECNFEEVRYVGQFIISSSNKTTENVMISGFYASYFFNSNTVGLGAIKKMICEIESKGYLIKLPIYQFNLIDYY